MDMLNTYLRLVVLAVVVLFLIWVVGAIIHLLIPALIIAAVVLGVIFLINLFRGRRPVGTLPGPR